MKISFSKIIIFSIFIFIILVFFLALNNEKRYSTENIVGKEIDNFEIKFLSNEEIFTKKDLDNGSYYLINIWASWCLPCRKEHPYLLKLKKNKNLKIIGINFKDKNMNAKNFLKELGNPYEVSLSDPDGTKSIVFGVFGVPETILINQNYIITKKFIGPLDSDDLSIIMKEIND